MDEPDGDYEGTVAEKTHSYRSDEKRILELIVEGLRPNTKRTLRIFISRISVRRYRTARLRRTGLFLISPQRRDVTQGRVSCG